MASAESPEPSGADELQFDHAEFTTPAPGAVTCRVCQRPIDGDYYELNQIVLCDGCRQGVEARFKGGTGLVGFAKACALGFLTAVGGAVIIYLVAAIAHIQAGIVSIFVGYLVGSAVRKGSGHRGGWNYQALAVFLTYSAVAWSYLPFIVQSFAEKAGQRQAQQALKNAEVAGGQKVNKVAPADEVDGTGVAKEARAGTVDAKTAGAVPGDKAAPGQRAKARMSAGEFARALLGMTVLLTSIAYIAPFLGLPNDILGLLIIGFGLVQAWRLNRRVTLSFKGPFRVGGGEPPRAEVPIHA